MTGSLAAEPVAPACELRAAGDDEAAAEPVRLRASREGILVDGGRLLASPATSPAGL